jgi:Na+/H+-dicarboxylate symporter
MMLTNIFFQAMWVSIIIGVIAYYSEKLFKIIEKGSNAVDTFGYYLEPWIPILAFLIGSFIYGLPHAIFQSVSPEVLAKMKEVNILGLKLSLQDESGLIIIYFIESFLIGIGCLLWQMIWVLITKKVIEGFSIKDFFKNYWLKIYPLAWATASEKLSMPLNMSLIKRKYKNISVTVRNLVVGLGSYLNINGTAMDVFVLSALVSIVVGHEISILTLLMSIPVIVLIGYGVPGIPGEQVLFAIPMVTILGIPTELTEAFMAIFVAIQLGLPDSFRTGANVTDNGLFAILLNKKYEKSLKKRARE